MNSLNQAKYSKKLVTSQGQAATKLLEKKDKDKRRISNWRNVSLVNANYKIMSKIFASRLNKVLPKFIASQQTAYVAQMLIKELMNIYSVLVKNEGKEVFSDKKTLDSLDDAFLINTQEYPIWFWDNFYRLDKNIFK